MTSGPVTAARFARAAAARAEPERGPELEPGPEREAQHHHGRAQQQQAGRCGEITVQEIRLDLPGHRCPEGPQIDEQAVADQDESRLQQLRSPVGPGIGVLVVQGIEQLTQLGPVRRAPPGGEPPPRDRYQVYPQCRQQEEPREQQGELRAEPRAPVQQRVHPADAGQAHQQHQDLAQPRVLGAPLPPAPQQSQPDQGRGGRAHVHRAQDVVRLRGPQPQPGQRRRVGRGQDDQGDHGQQQTARSELRTPGPALQDEHDGEQQRGQRQRDLGERRGRAEQEVRPAGGNGSRSTSTRKSITNTAAPANIHRASTFRGQRRPMPASRISAIMITVMTRTAARPTGQASSGQRSPRSAAPPRRSRWRTAAAGKTGAAPAADPGTAVPGA